MWPSGQPVSVDWSWHWILCRSSWVDTWHMPRLGGLQVLVLFLRLGGDGEAEEAFRRKEGLWKFQKSPLGNPGGHWLSIDAIAGSTEGNK